MKYILALYLVAALISAVAQAQNSDPAGGWSTCRHFTTGKEIVVEGPTCPRNWMKVY